MKDPRGPGGTKAVSNGALVGATAAAQVKGRDRSLQREQKSLPQGFQWEVGEKKRGERGETGAEGEKGRETQ